MQRRDFIKLVGGATISWPLVARAQQQMPILGFLSAVSPGPFAQRMAAFYRGLSEVGYTDGKNLVIESRWAEEKYERLPALAAELIDLRVGRHVLDIRFRREKDGTGFQVTRGDRKIVETRSIVQASDLIRAHAPA